MINRLYFVTLLFTLVGCAVYQNELYEYKSKQELIELHVSSTMLDCRCHTQGVAWDENSKSIISTCQGADGYSYILLFPEYGSENKTQAIDVYKTNLGLGYSHPSAIQIENGVFPVAFTDGKRDGTVIQFFKIENRRIKLVPNQKINYDNHIGALSYFQKDNQFYMLGMEWDSKNYAQWSSKFAYQDFSLIKKGSIKDITAEKTGAYNSIWFGELLNKELKLMASCGSFYSKKKNYVDIFDLNLETLKLTNKQRLYVGNTTRKSHRSLFFEGVTVKSNNENMFTIISSPHDYKKRNGSSYINYIYEGEIKK